MWPDGVAAPPSARPSLNGKADLQGKHASRKRPRVASPRGFAGEVLPIVTLIGLTLVFFWKIAFTGLVLAGYDTQTYFYPYRLEAADAIRNGRLPLWDPYLFLGAPFMANVQTAIFYPLNALFYVMPVPYAMNASIITHIALAGILMYAFGRSSLGLDRLGSLVAAIAFMFSGFMGAQVGHINQINVAAWLPGLLVCLDQAVWRRSGLWAAAGALVVAFQMLAGHSQESYFILVTSGLYAAFRIVVPRADLVLPGPLWRGDRFAPALAYAAIATLGVGMSLLQLLPTLELAGESIRGGGLSYGDAVSFSLRPWELLDDLLPTFVRIPFTEYVGYVGIFALTLGGLALATGWRRPLSLFFFALMAMGIFFGLGGFNPLWVWAHKLIPGFKLFRVPARWLYVSTFGAACLAGIGADFLGRAEFAPRSRRWLVRHPLLAAAAGLLAISVALGLASRGQADSETATRARWALLFAVAIGLALLAFTARHRRPYQALFAGLLALELFLASRRLAYNGPLPTEVYTDVRPPEALLTTDRSVFRALSIAADTYEPGDKAQLTRLFGPDLTADELEQFLVETKWKEVLTPNLSMAYHVADLDGYDGGVLPLRRYVALKKLYVPPCPGCDNPDEILRYQIRTASELDWFSLLNVKYFIADKIRDGFDGPTYYDLTNAVTLDAGRRSLHLRGFTPSPATAIGLVTSLTGAQSIAQGTPVADVAVTDGAGRTYELQLTAGVDTAEAAWTPAALHQQPKPFPPGGSPNAPRDYLAVLPLPDGTWVTSVDVTYLPVAGQLRVDGATLVEGTFGSSVSIPVAENGALTTVQSGDTKVYRNNAVAPRAFLQPSAQIVRDDTAAFATVQTLTARGLMPGGVAVITYPGAETHPSLPYRLLYALADRLNGAGTPKAPPTLDPPAAAFAPSVTIERNEPERVQIETEAARAAYLVVSNAYYPGWTATVDGQPATIYPADYLLTGIYIPRGKHVVVLQYRSRFLRLGVLLSATAAVATVAIARLRWAPSRPA